MENAVQPNAQEPSREKAKKMKKDRVSWWQSLIILAVTLAVCLTAGYYISSKYLWNKKNDQLDKQLTYYKEQVNEKPNDPKLRVQLGYTYFLKGDDSAAMKEYTTAKSLDKNYYDAYLNLSIVYDKEKRYDDALQMAIKAVKISPRDYKGQLLKGRSYRKLKMYDKATAALQEAYRLKNGNTDVIYEAGLVAVAQGKKAEAEQLFKEALSFDPTYKPALNALDKLNAKNK
ncbi:tetratricopeptide repeat protein [Neobacillus cucumis]|uniref:tetratricopeptide repeat protein n=1 Tax=Neobacillus cucumis TaxID=1740721 RepID=UPI0028531EA3|nr:tetratricopeptide repeat protein [Neobacillus cucumis]MDR4949456.1 tetratricopeptide repeat protein [Neobacillus cucumis]